MVVVKSFEEHRSDTHLDVRSIAEMFRSSVLDRKGLFTKNLLEWDFYTPERSDDPFAALDDSPEPAFVAGASFYDPKAGRPADRTRIKWEEIKLAGSTGALELEIYDLGDSRRLALFHFGGRHTTAKKVVRAFQEAVIRRDPSAAWQSRTQKN